MKFTAGWVAMVSGLLFLAPVSGHAQTADPPNPLAAVKALKCRFPVATSGTWKAGRRSPERGRLLLQVNNIDVQGQDGRGRGNRRSRHVSAVLSGWSLYSSRTRWGS
jgi:hypothetical protein